MKDKTRVTFTGLKRDISWKDGFWMSCGVPLGVFTTIGGVVAVAGKVSWLVFIVSVCIGFLQALTYAEIAGLYPNKSGGASVYGAMAWLRYTKIIAPLSTWCNWFAWSPILSIVSGLAATYIVQLFPASSVVNTWQITLLDLGWVMSGLTLRINFTWFIALICLILIFTIQHYGIAKAAKIQTAFSRIAIVIIFVIALAPIITGRIPLANVWPLEIGSGQTGLNGWGIIFAALFIAGYSTYGFETAICYVSEFKDPRKDTFKAIVAAGILCLVAFSLVPFSFQGFLGKSGILADNIMNGSGVAAAMASMVGNGHIIYLVTYFMFLFVVITSLMTAMAGSSRTIYQASVDGWLPKYLSKVNKHGAPVAAMWTDLCFNVVLLTFSNYFFILIAANVCYMIFVFLNLNSGWIHRMDNKDMERPFRAPKTILISNTVISYLNIIFVGAYAGRVESGSVLSGFLWAMMIIPVFLFRHYIVDKGRFPDHVYDDLQCKSGETPQRNAHVLPYVTIIAGIAVFILSFLTFKLT